MPPCYAKKTIPPDDSWDLADLVDDSYVSVVSTFPNTFALVLDSNLHELNGTNPD
mgnify:CR=1 FL=1